MEYRIEAYLIALKMPIFPTNLLIKNDIKAMPIISKPKAKPICEGSIWFFFNRVGKVTKLTPMAEAKQKKLKYKNLVGCKNSKLKKVFNINKIFLIVILTLWQ